MLDLALLFATCAPAVSPETLGAIVRVESGSSPFVIGVNGAARLPRQPATKAEAVATATDLIAKGYNIDLGIAQINSKNLRLYGMSVADAFDSCKNIALGARILSENYAQALKTQKTQKAALDAALSAYNTGSQVNGVANGYVSKIYAAAGLSQHAPSASFVPGSVAHSGRKSTEREARLAPLQVALN